MLTDRFTWGRYVLNILIAIDQFGNALTFGDPDETISSRLGRLELKHGGVIPWYRPLSKVIAWGLDKIDEDHCFDAIEYDEGDDGFWM